MSTSQEPKFLLIRDPKFHPKDTRHKIRLYEPGYKSDFTQSKVNAGNPYDPKKFNVGDKIWLAEANYGVLALCRITEKPKIFCVTSKKELDDFRLMCHSNLQMDTGYWEFEEKKVKRIKEGKNLKILRIPYEVVDIDFPHFPINRPRTAQNSLVYLENNPEYLIWKEHKTVHEYLLERARESRRDKFITKITPDVRNKAYMLYGDKGFLKKDNEEDNDFDHLIPKSILGIGFLIENIVPVGPNYNRATKSNKIPYSFFPSLKALYPELLTDEFSLLFKEELAYSGSYQGALPSVQPKKDKVALFTKIMRAILEKSLEEQRFFYFCNGVLFYGNEYYERFEANKKRKDIWQERYNYTNVKTVLELPFDLV